MNIKKHPRLMLVLTALFVLVCRCGTSAAPPQTTSDGREITECSFYIDSATGSSPISPGKGMTCKLSCPTGLGSIEKSFIMPEGSQPRIADLTYDQLFDQVCNNISNEIFLVAPNPSTGASNEAPPTEAPTEEPAPTEPPTEEPAEVKPLLTGVVTACDTAQGYINFTLAESNPDIVGKTLGVTINGTAVNCGIPAVNTSILACSLLPGTAFPITVSVTLDGVEVNNFTNDGYFCTNTTNNPGGDPNQEEEQPLVPAACVYDQANPYACLP